MISIIYGAKGTGKTKKIIDSANQSVLDEKGIVVFVTDTTRYTRDVKQPIRFTSVKDLAITTEDGLVGFVQGMLEANYDLSRVYIDGVGRILDKKPAELGSFFARLDAIAQKSDVTFVITVSADKADLPEFILKYVND